MASNHSEVSTRAVPIVSHLCLPEKEGEDAYLRGFRCRVCGETYLGNTRRVVCVKCSGRDPEMVALGRTGELFSFTIVHQSAPGVPVPYIAAVVKLPEGPFVAANLSGCDPAKPKLLRVGMRLEMFTEKVRVDPAGNDIIAYRYRPV